MMTKVIYVLQHNQKLAIGTRVMVIGEQTDYNTQWQVLNMPQTLNSLRPSDAYKGQ